MSRPVRIYLFATARLTVGERCLSWPVPEPGLTAEELIAELRSRYPGLTPILRASRFLRNGRYLNRLDERLRPGDEFAVHPPYGGG